MTLRFIFGYTLVTILVISTLISWYLLISGKFKTQYMMPSRGEERTRKAKKWFFIQSLLFLIAAGIAYLRLAQLATGHSDNVIENLVYGVSSLLFIRAVGETKMLGLFRTETDNDFAPIDKKVLTPFFLLLFALSLALIKI